MKTLLFHVNSLLAGGIEKVLIELLSGLDPAKYHIKLSIAHNLGDLELLRSRIPPYVEVSYILDTPILTNTKKKKVTKNISLPAKLFEDLVLPPFKKMVHVKKLKKLIKDVDVIIDFDMTLAGYTSLFSGKKRSPIATSVSITTGVVAKESWTNMLPVSKSMIPSLCYAKK